jgi:hypothetical protein
VLRATAQVRCRGCWTERTWRRYAVGSVSRTRPPARSSNAITAAVWRADRSWRRPYRHASRLPFGSRRWSCAASRSCLGRVEDTEGLARLYPDTCARATRLSGFRALVASLLPSQIVPLAKPLSELIGTVSPFLRIANNASGRRNRQHRSPIRPAINRHSKSGFGTVRMAC